MFLRTHKLIPLVTTPSNSQQQQRHHFRHYSIRHHPNFIRFFFRSHPLLAVQTIDMGTPSSIWSSCTWDTLLRITSFILFKMVWFERGSDIYRVLLRAWETWKWVYCFCFLLSTTSFVWWRILIFIVFYFRCHVSMW